MEKSEIHRRSISVEDYLDSLQEFLEGRFDEDICSDFFLSEHHEGGVIANILVGALFDDTDYVKQINVILVPRADMEEEPTISEDPFDLAKSVL